MVAQFAGGAAAGDIDGDGDIDVFVARGDDGPNLLYVNQGGTGFEERALAAGVQCRFAQVDLLADGAAAALEALGEPFDLVFDWELLCFFWCIAKH